MERTSSPANPMTSALAKIATDNIDWSDARVIDINLPSNGIATWGVGISANNSTFWTEREAYYQQSTITQAWHHLS